MQAVMERFPASLIQEPTAFTSRDPMEMYNNILVFTVADDSGSGQRAEMHIFQCQSVSAQDLVEDLKMLQMGKLVPGGSPRGPRGRIPPPPTLPPPEPPLNGVNVREQVSAFSANNGMVLSYLFSLIHLFLFEYFVKYKSIRWNNLLSLFFETQPIIKMIYLARRTMTKCPRHLPKSMNAT